MAKVIVVDEQRCLACKSCVLECAMAHTEARSLVEAIQSDNRPQPRIHVEAMEQFGMPMQCRHCEDAPCMEVCPKDAISRLSETGPVILDQDQCIGCRLCLRACPFGVIDMSRDQKAVVKCDLCIDRTSAGEDPACVSACPTGALKFVELDDALRDQRKKATAELADDDESKRTNAKGKKVPAKALKLVEVDEFLRNRRWKAAAYLADGRKP